ncbi:glycine receptor subunit alpha-2-like protein [Leptotrombidium deliense]|uniref:Glycine receptor subunit alpha-2-like protein n=1 Tax=Leptotrombidium deliense TaxID=299467 RepID=A0A443S8Y0_9ACAR|nr:glycine receptor subunit alpha-2-like protein [Leptotrombidium deliense]
MRDKECDEWNDTLSKVGSIVDESGVEIKNKKLMWTPDIFILNAKSEDKQSKTLETEFVQLRTRKEIVKEDNGQSVEKEVCFVNYFGRFSAVVACALEFKRYPVDVQKCTIQLRSFQYDESQIILSWERKHGILIDEHTDLAEFDIRKRNFTSFTFNWFTGQLKSIKAEFH